MEQKLGLLNQAPLSVIGVTFIDQNQMPTV